MLGWGLRVEFWLTWIVFKRTLRNVSVPSLDLMAMVRQCWACWSHEICLRCSKRGEPWSANSFMISANAHWLCVSKQTDNGCNTKGPCAPS